MKPPLACIRWSVSKNKQSFVYQGAIGLIRSKDCIRYVLALCGAGLFVLFVRCWHAVAMNTALTVEGVCVVPEKVVRKGVHLKCLCMNAGLKYTLQKCLGSCCRI